MTSQPPPSARAQEPVLSERIRPSYELGALPRGSWISLNGSWVIVGIMLMSVVIGLALGVLLNREDDKLGPACDRAVERLLTTHDVVELERSRFLIKRLECSVSDRIKSWSAERNGGLKDAAEER